jgi:hypothetical protein
MTREGRVSCYYSHSQHTQHLYRSTSVKFTANNFSFVGVKFPANNFSFVGVKFPANNFSFVGVKFTANHFSFVGVKFTANNFSFIGFEVLTAVVMTILFCEIHRRGLTSVFTVAPYSYSSTLQVDVTFLNIG